MTTDPIGAWLAAQNPPRQRETDPLKRLHNLVDNLQRCDRCQSEMTRDDEPVVLCAACASPLSDPAREDETKVGGVVLETGEEG